MFEPRLAPPVALRPMVNPRPTVSVLPIFDGHQCVIVDNFLAEPETMVNYAVFQREQFRDAAHNYYPGPELPVTGRFVTSVQEAYLLYARGPQKARRVLETNCRLSMVTRRPDQLLPGQRIPHKDSSDLTGLEGAGAMVLYLFKDERLGGTSFFKPKVAPQEIAAMVGELKRMELAGESPVLTAPPTYAVSSDDYFQKMLTIPPKFNRAIFYNGDLYHSGHITAPELMVGDPTIGRLTVNGFFKLRMAAV